MVKCMKFIDIPQFGGSEVMCFGHTDKPSVTESQLLVKVAAIGVNRADILQRQGKYPPPAGESDIVGLEVCGEVVEAADDAWLGKMVFGLVPGGAYAQYCLLNAAHAFELPSGYSAVEGAGIAEVFLTAYQGIFQIGQFVRGQTVLIHAGASGVGSAGIQLVKAMGGDVIVTVGSEQKAQFCRDLGADLVINYKQDDFVAPIKGFCKAQGIQGVDVVLDCVAGEYIAKDIDCIALDGKIVVIAMMGGRFVVSLDMAKMLAKRVSIVASTLRNRSDHYKSQLIDDFKKQFWQALTTRQIQPVIDKVFDWQQAAKAHDYIEGNFNQGKVVLVPNPKSLEG